MLSGMEALLCHSSGLLRHGLSEFGLAATRAKSRERFNEISIKKNAVSKIGKGEQ
jgi:hypothetical protein